jgi:hypothetical protein
MRLAGDRRAAAARVADAHSEQNGHDNFGRAESRPRRIQGNAQNNPCDQGRWEAAAALWGVQNQAYRVQLRRQPEAVKRAARCNVLQELLEHHIEEEESDYLKNARKLLDRAVLEKMGKDFASEKSKVGASTHSAVVAE